MQTVKLNLIPGSVLPVVNVSQYDEKRQFALQVYEGATAYSLSGKSVQIRGTKPDGNGFAYDAQDGVVSVSGSTVTISTTQQMTAVGGQTMAELRITQSGVILGTLNFILMVEPSALSDDTPISDTDIPAIERDFEAALAEAEADALKAEGYAVGTQDGVPAQSGEPYYEDNAKYYKEQAEAAASGGGADALKAEGYAVGTQNGVPVTSGSPYYHNNAAYYEGEASTSATNAGNSETAAAGSASAASADALKSEGFAVGEQNGTPVSSGSPYYQNNAAYYAAQAGQYATGGLIFKGSVAFANIPTTGMVNGDMYNITDDFTTDSRFIEGAGVAVKAGADIAYVAGSVNKWDILALGGGGGADALDDLTDVDITSAADGQGLVYNGTTQEWENADVVLPDELADTMQNVVGWTGKNRNSVPYYEMSRTYHNIQYVVQPGGAVVANRVGAAQDSSLVLHYREKSYAYPLILPNGTWKLTGCPAGGSETTYYIEAAITKNGARQVLGSDTGSGLILNLTGDDYSNTETCLGLVINIKAATASVVNLTFEPMVSKEGLPYEPYHDSIGKYAEAVPALEQTGAVNKLPNTSITQTQVGVTVTHNDDDTLAFNGTATGIGYIQVVDRYQFGFSGQYKLTGCPANGSAESYKMDLYDITTSRQVGRDSGDGVVVTIDASHTYRVTIGIYAPTVFNNLIFKPMLSDARLNLSYDDYHPYAMTNRELTVGTDASVATNVHLLKIGRIVYCSIPGWTAVSAITIPVGYRPSGNILMTCEQRESYGATPSIARVTIKSDGSIGLSASNTELIGNIWWEVNI